jgi:putative intracellular protease/amidase
MGRAWVVRCGLVYTAAVCTASNLLRQNLLVKNITLSADEALIEAARARARSEQTTLNEAFRHWLAGYARTDERLQRYEAAMAEVRGRLKVGRKLSREAMNER